MLSIGIHDGDAEFDAIHLGVKFAALLWRLVNAD